MKITNPSHLYSKLNRSLSLFSAQIGLTNRCNENCIHCLVCRRPACELTTREVKAIICELRELNCMNVTFTGGEAMLREDFFEILNFTKQKGIGIKFLSNGTLVSETNIKQLKIINPLNIQISLYGATSKTHDYTTRLKGSFDMTANALRLFRENKIKFSVATMVMRHNFHELPRMKEISKKNRWKIMFDFLIRPRDDGYKTPLKTRVTDSQIKQAIKLRLLPFVTKQGNLRHGKKKNLCVSNIGRIHIYVSHEGNVFPNIGSRIGIGNIKNERLGDIWQNSKKLSWLRNLTISGFECSKCSYLLNCCWDPGLALQEHQDFFKRPKESCRFMRHIVAAGIK